jgi:uncharacterized membrane protein YphA (DoxX/SURF4 family)
MNAIARYFQELAERFGSGWNRFWFTPVDPIGLCLVRALTGMMSLWFILSFTPDLITWMGPDGLLPIDTVRQLTVDDRGWNGRASYLYFVDEPGLLWGVHLVAIAIAATFTLGLATRITSVVTLAIVLSYIHRMPMVTGPFEPVLSFMLFYLCLAPCGQAISLDAWLKRSRRDESKDRKESEGPLSLAAGIVQRLMQVHVAALFVMMGLTKLGGSDTWWVGEAVWWLIAHSESRLVDWTFLHRWPYLINLWTLSIVAFELLYGLLIWNRLARPLLIAFSILHWLLIGLVTGLLSYAAMMIIVNVAFVSPTWLRSLFTRPSAASPVSLAIS